MMPPTPLSFSRGLVLAFALVLAVPALAEAVTIVDPGQAPVTITGIGNPEFSGLAHQGGGAFLAVADSGATLHSLQVAIDSSTGFVTSVTGATPPVSLAAGVDLEGLVWRPSTSTVFASDEVGPAIREYDPTTGAVLSSFSVPTVYSSALLNRSLEGLAMAPDESAFWTANETALSVDGPQPNVGVPTRVRLQRFDASGAATAQYAYASEPGFLLGVVELLVLPTGELLAMERFLGQNGFEASLYEVDLSGATETSALASVDAPGVQPVGKSLLWTRATGDNFEAVSLGPALDGGDLSLVLTSDGGGALPPRIFALRLQVPEPGTAWLLVCAFLGLGAFRRSE